MCIAAFSTRLRRFYICTEQYVCRNYLSWQASVRTKHISKTRQDFAVYFRKNDFNDLCFYLQPIITLCKYISLCKSCMNFEWLSSNCSESGRHCHCRYSYEVGLQLLFLVWMALQPGARLFHTTVLCLTLLCFSVRLVKTMWNQQLDGSRLLEKECISM